MEKSTDDSNIQIVNLAVANHPEILYSDAAVLDTKIKLIRKDENGKMLTRNSILSTQLKRALNLYFRPEVYSEKNFDDFALSLTSGINQE